MATVHLEPFIPGQSPAMASSALKRAVRAYAQARHCAVLWFQDINSRELFRKLGYSSIYAYASKELGFSTSKTGDFLRLARALKELPVLKREMEAGRIGYTKAREIISVAPPGNGKNVGRKGAEGFPQEAERRRAAGQAGSQGPPP